MQAKVRDMCLAVIAEAGHTDKWLSEELNIELVSKHDTLDYLPDTEMKSKRIFDSSETKDDEIRNYKISDSKAEIFVVTSIYACHNISFTATNQTLADFKQMRFECHSKLVTSYNRSVLHEIPLFLLTGNRLVNDGGAMLNGIKEKAFFDVQMPWVMPRDTSGKIELIPASGLTTAADGATTTPEFISAKPDIENDRAFALYLYYNGFMVSPAKKTGTSGQ